MTRFEVRTGDCLAVMRTLEDSSVDSIVTDPPYELGFMGKSWDASGVAFRVEVWREALRVLKPGGHLLAFSGSRTYHRMAVAIEDAGFEIRDQIMWVYGSGFPKSLDVSKAIDAAVGAEREVIGSWKPTGTARPSREGGGHSAARTTADGGYNAADDATVPITAPATPEAQRWQGWGTALKPAHEPIVVARKPLVGTVAANVLAHGTGAINIDGCRVGTEVTGWDGTTSAVDNSTSYRLKKTGEPRPVVGRWPANLIHDGSAEVVDLFPDTGPSKAAFRGLQNSGRHGGISDAGRNLRTGTNDKRGHDDAGGSAARFFYCSKASKRDRDEGLRAEGRANIHPTVKPTDLMRYLCRLVTPPEGLVLDPFTGSGSTGKGAVLEGFRFLGIELSPEYTEIARARIRHAVGHVAPEPVTEAKVPDALPGQLRLFA